MNIIILGCHKGLTRSVIKSLQTSRLSFSYIGTGELTRLVSKSKFCKGIYEIEEADLSIDSMNIKEMIKPLLSEKKPNYIIPTGIRSTLYVSRYLRDHNQFPISDYQTLSMLNNKWDFYLFLKEQKLPAPETFLLSHSVLDEAGSLLHFPVITKPLDSEDSRNVVKSSHPYELREVIEGSAIPLLVQEFIPGYDLNLGIFSLNGEIKAWIVNRRTDLGLVFEHHPAVLEIGKRIVNELQFSGIIHFDIRVNEQEGTYFVLECNPRVWGSMLHSTYSGVNFLEMALKPENYHFQEIVAGTVSLNKNSLVKKLVGLRLKKQDFKSILIQTKFFIDDPIYEITYLLH